MSDAPILLDASRLIWRRWTGRLPTGIDRVCLAYLRHFAPRARAVIQFRQFRQILNRDDSGRLFELLLGERDGFRTDLIRILSPAALRGEASAAGQIYLNVGHTGLNSPYLAPWLRARGLRPVFLVHDLIPISHPQYCRPAEAERHGERISQALESAREIIVNSSATGQHLARFARERGLPMPPWLVAWLGIDRPAPASAAIARDRPYFVVVGTIEARKNHLLLLDLWADLVAQLGEKTPELLIIGQRGWEAEAAIAILDDPGPLKGHIRELDRCDDAQMHQLIAGARALLMPSFVEGFGIPLIEALSMGTPVIASDLGVFREIAGGIPDFCDPDDKAEWLGTVIDYSKDGRRRQAQLDRIEGFETPSWSCHFDRVERFLDAMPGPSTPKFSAREFMKVPTCADGSVILATDVCPPPPAPKRG